MIYSRHAQVQMLKTLARFLIALSLTAPVWALDVKFAPVGEGAYAYVGETGARSYDNEGLNANIGLLVTPSGAVLIDSGASFQSARKIHEAVKAVTQQPVRWVINTGGQDHRWLGNGYFAAQGAQIIAHESTRADMQARGGDHIAALKATLKERAEGTLPTLPTRWVSGAETPLELGGLPLVLRHSGGGHTPGDMMVWLPRQRLLYAGDIVYVDRMLSVIPVSNTKAWLSALDDIEQLQPARIVPGHGNVTNLATAQTHSRDYLRALRTHMKKAVDDSTDVSAAAKSFNAQPWATLHNAAELLPGNASRTYLELERE
jgi:glyoxylase-like metal-dependent hydrolase (beta-lactamase superfamily II)